MTPTQNNPSIGESGGAEAAKELAHDLLVSHDEPQNERAIYETLIDHIDALAATQSSPAGPEKDSGLGRCVQPAEGVQPEPSGESDGPDQCEYADNNSDGTCGREGCEFGNPCSANTPTPSPPVSPEGPDWKYLLGEFEWMIGFARMFAEQAGEKAFSDDLLRRWRELREAASPGHIAAMEELEKLTAANSTPTPQPTEGPWKVGDCLTVDHAEFGPSEVTLDAQGAAIANAAARIEAAHEATLEWPTEGGAEGPQELEGGEESRKAISAVMQATVDRLARRQRQSRQNGEALNGDGWIIDGNHYYARRQTTTPEYWNILREPDDYCVDTIKGDGPAESMVRHLDAAYQAGASSMGSGDVAAAKSHDYPLFDLDRALEIVERVKAFVGGDIDPELASVSTVLADLDNLTLCLKLAANPPAPTGGGDELESKIGYGNPVMIYCDGPMAPWFVTPLVGDPNEIAEGLKAGEGDSLIEAAADAQALATQTPEGSAE